MFLVLVFGLAAAAAAMPLDSTTEVAPTGDSVPATVQTENGVFITNGTPDKRCWMFVPLPPPQQNQPNNSRRPYSYFYNMYANSFRYPYYYYYGRPGRRPSKNNNNNNNNQNSSDDLPVFGADGEEYVQNDGNGQEYNENGQQFGENGQPFLENGKQIVNGQQFFDNGQQFPGNGQQFFDNNQQLPGNGQHFGGNGGGVSAQTGLNNNFGGEVQT